MLPLPDYFDFERNFYFYINIYGRLYPQLGTLLIPGNDSIFPNVLVHIPFSGDSIFRVSITKSGILNRQRVRVLEAINEEAERVILKWRQYELCDLDPNRYPLRFCNYLDIEKWFAFICRVAEEQAEYRTHNNVKSYAITVNFHPIRCFKSFQAAELALHRLLEQHINTPKFNNWWRISTEEAPSRDGIVIEVCRYKYSPTGLPKEVVESKMVFHIMPYVMNIPNTTSLSSEKHEQDDKTGYISGSPVLLRGYQGRGPSLGEEFA